jgi:peptidoglycan/LPS O-acetylase OafA/YrhL
MARRPQPDRPSQVWAAAPYVLVRRYGDLRGRCAWCGAPTTGSMRLDVSALGPLWQILFVFGPVPDLPFAWFVEKRAELDVGLCDRHRRRRRRARQVGWGSVAMGAALMALAFVPSRESNWPVVLFPGALLLVIVGMLVAALGTRGPTGQMADSRGVWVRGIASEVVFDLPPTGHRPAGWSAR